MPEMESFIEMFYNNAIQTQEAHILKAVADCGIHVDKERLIQAITDARKFWQEGYEAGLNRYIITCKQCRFWDEDKKGFSDECLCKRWSTEGVADYFTEPESFCSYADLKERRCE